MKLRSIALLCVFALVIINLGAIVYADTEDIDIETGYFGPLWDCNHDGITDYLDVSLLAGMYGQSGSPPKTWTRADITEDGLVDYVDVSSLAGHYGENWLDI